MAALEVRRTHRGIEFWNNGKHADRMVRKVRIGFLSASLADHGLYQIARTARQFTEAHTILPGRQFKQTILQMRAHSTIGDWRSYVFSQEEKMISRVHFILFASE